LSVSEQGYILRPKSSNGPRYENSGINYAFDFKPLLKKNWGNKVNASKNARARIQSAHAHSIRVGPQRNRNVGIKTGGAEEAYASYSSVNCVGIPSKRNYLMSSSANWNDSKSKDGKAGQQNSRSILAPALIQPQTSLIHE